MRSKSQSQSLARITSIEIGHEESAVVQVEGGETTGYLISEAYAVGEPPSEITLSNVIYLCARYGGVETTEATEVLVTTKNDYWFAVETGEVSIIPCPSREPYPIIFISKRGYRWMEEMIRHGNFPRLLAHLSERFQPSRFVTSRKILEGPSSPFNIASRIRTTPIKPQG
jgi:hypothetical protein